MQQESIATNDRILIKEVSASCLHCGRPLAPAQVQFCCEGCHTIHDNLHALGLQDFYRLKNFDATPVAVPLYNPGTHTYREFDRPEFLEKMDIEERDGVRRVRLAIEGLYCAGCAWVLEKLPDLMKGVKEARVNLATSELTLRYAADSSLAAIATFLDSLGYRVAPVKRGEAPIDRVGRQLLIRLAVAGLCAANTMMLAVSLYEGDQSGIEPRFSNFFLWVSLVLSLPSIFFSAQVFYRNALQSLRAGVPSLDLPISVAVLFGFALSVVNTALGSRVVYYDSLTVLIFLLLAGRYALHRVTLKARLQAVRGWEFLPLRARKRSGTGFEDVSVASLVSGDHIEVKAGERLPVDGCVVSGRSSLDCSVLNGESQPQSCNLGDRLFAGTLNLEAPLIVEVVAIGERTRLGAIFAKLEQSDLGRSPIELMTQRVSRYFVWVVLLLSVITVALWYTEGLFVALQNAVALLVVTCPCALGLATPVAFSVALGRAGRKGILVKSSEALEKIARSRTVFFDKTGTLTNAQLKVQSAWIASQASRSVIAALANLSSHPASSAVAHHLQHAVPTTMPSAITQGQLLPGRGIAARDQDGHLVKLGSVGWILPDLKSIPDALVTALQEADRQGTSLLLFAVDAELQGFFLLEDSRREFAGELIALLRGKNRKLAIVSGDRQPSVEHLAQSLGIEKENCFGGCLPDDKAITTRGGTSPTVFVGDGFNDALAMKAADASIGMQGGIEASLEVADVFLARSDLRLVAATFQVAEQTLSVVRRNLTFSLGYNCFAALLAMAGMISPLVAALLMPISSVVVLTNSYQAGKSPLLQDE